MKRKKWVKLGRVSHQTLQLHYRYSQQTKKVLSKAPLNDKNDITVIQYKMFIINVHELCQFGTISP